MDKGTINRVILKAKYAFYCALLFFLFANPYTYEVTNQYFGGFVLDGDRPTPAGFGLHVIFFFLTLTGLMLAPV